MEAPHTLIVLLLCSFTIAQALTVVRPHALKRNFTEYHDYPVSDNEFARRMDAVSRQKLERLVVNYLGEAFMPGAGLAVTRDGLVLYANGFGWADDENATYYKSKFRIASVSKPLTLTGILRLVEQGVLALDEKVFTDRLLGRYLSSNFTDTTGRVSKVTVRHLLTHASGFPSSDIQENQELSNEEYLRWAVEEYAPLQLEPDTQYIYCNFGFFLLGRVLEVLSNTSYTDFIQSAVLGPMGVKGAVISADLPWEREPDEVVYYSYNIPNIAPYMYSMKRLDSVGGWAVSMLELVGFMSKLESFLRPETVQLMLAPSILSNRSGLCWIVEDRRNGSVEYWHNGNLPGTSSHAHRWEADGHVYTYTFATNRNIIDIAGYSEYLFKPLALIIQAANFASSTTASATESATSTSAIVTTAIKTSTLTATSASMSFSSTVRPNTDNSGLPVWVIIFISFIGGCIISAIVTSAVWLLIKKKTDKRNEIEPSKDNPL